MTRNSLTDPTAGITYKQGVCRHKKTPEDLANHIHKKMIFRRKNLAGQPIFNPFSPIGSILGSIPPRASPPPGLGLFRPKQRPGPGAAQTSPAGTGWGRQQRRGRPLAAEPRCVRHPAGDPPPPPPWQWLAGWLPQTSAHRFEADRTSHRLWLRLAIFGVRWVIFGQFLGNVWPFAVTLPNV